MIKPDAVENGYIGAILAKIIASGQNSFYEDDSIVPT